MDKLEGDRCIIHCSIKNTRVLILIDTGAQVPIVEGKYLNKNLPHIKSISDSLRGKWGNSRDIPFKGFLNLGLVWEVLMKHQCKYHSF